VGLVSAAVEQKLTQLGFSPGGLGMELTIGNLKLQVVEGPMLMISMSSFGPRSMCSYDVKCPTFCSKEQIAGLIYLNVSMNFQNDAELLKAHFQSLGIPLFQ
jgi:hypothetical protein